MSIGQRVALRDKCGTIRYVGEVPPHKGLFYGIDWDNPTDGKHNGCYNGVQYFTASHPKSGSFVKASEVYTGLKFTDAAKEIYETDMDYSGGVFTPEQMKNAQIEIFGVEKARRYHGSLDTIRTLYLTNGVSSAGEYGEIKQLCPCVEELYLTDNLIADWETLALIGKQLKNLTSLSINRSRVRMPIDPASLKDCFVKLETLAMCSCSYTWQDIIQNEIMWPSLQNLYVAANKITTLQEPIVLQNLVLLDLAYNNISSWDEVNKLGNMKRLETLYLSGNPITRITIPKNSGLFPALHTLYLANAEVSNWSDMQDLNNLPSLRSLKFIRNPVMRHETPVVYRDKIMARIASIEILNGREITPEERKTAEYEYVREFGDEWHRARVDDGTLQNFRNEHPRYEELINFYGAPPASERWTKSLMLKSNLVSLNLCLMAEDGTPMKSFTKKFHCSLVVYKLVTIVKRLFNTSSNRPKLTVVFSETPGKQMEMEDLMKSLDHYGVNDGDTVLVVDF